MEKRKCKIKDIEGNGYLRNFYVECSGIPSYLIIHGDTQLPYDQDSYIVDTYNNFFIVNFILQ